MRFFIEANDPKTTIESIVEDFSNLLEEQRDQDFKHTATKLYFKEENYQLRLRSFDKNNLKKYYKNKPIVILIEITYKDSLYPEPRVIEKEECHSVYDLKIKLFNTINKIKNYNRHTLKRMVEKYELCKNAVLLHGEENQEEEYYTNEFFKLKIGYRSNLKELQKSENEIDYIDSLLSYGYCVIYNNLEKQNHSILIIKENEKNVDKIIKSVVTTLLKINQKDKEGK